MKLKFTLLFIAIAGILHAQPSHQKPTGNPPVANFTVSDTSICLGGSVNFMDISTNSPTGWKWTFTGGVPDTSSSKNPDTITYSAAGTYPVKLVVKNNSGSDSITMSGYIKVYPHPNGKLTNNLGGGCICQFDSVKMTATGGNYYQWKPLNSGLRHYGPLPISGNDTDVNMASPLIPTIYTVYVHTWGCYDTVYDTMCVVPGAKANFCCDTTVASGTHVLLTAIPAPGYAQTVANWSGPNLDTNYGDSVIATPNGSSWYYIYLLNTITGCVHKDSIFIDVYADISSISNPIQLKASPNPVTSQLLVTLINPTHEEGEIFISDITGRRLFDYNLTPANYQYPIDVSSLAPGVYLLNLKTSNRLLVSKFVKE